MGSNHQHFLDGRRKGLPGRHGLRCGKGRPHIGFTKSLSRELARHGITVTAVMPRFVLTEMTRALAPAAIEGIKNLHGYKRARLC